MPLIIESYDCPYTKIASLLFPEQEFTYIDKPVSEPASELFCYTRAEDNPDKIKYYFNRIYFIEKERIVCINKASQRIKFYDINTGKLITFEQRTEDADGVSKIKTVDKTDFLPQLHAQNGEIVIFPDQEEDEE
ncbi:uncharacterized protein VICG_01707 [Vittaforma corneae ATCC 50505]|uniref:Uncharacterized protein n=1 Tax=Vittaforma corneae (strain ATCC 50505) TaxID=993615 RepID=L2GK09_VITCO|nr:uncharacterized protein VICG_01707 [Vittaforma corneae ATCC 50505]ELA41218.1 hypothetical protein VICG_01707 [Vittaforma corneae ATCC 50505]